MCEFAPPFLELVSGDNMAQHEDLRFEKMKRKMRELVLHPFEHPKKIGKLGAAPQFVWLLWRTRVQRVQGMTCDQVGLLKF
jgi:hypothetical protein